MPVHIHHMWVAKRLEGHTMALSPKHAIHLAIIHSSLFTRPSVVDRKCNHVQVLVLLTDGRVDAYQAHEVC